LQAAKAKEREEAKAAKAAASSQKKRSRPARKKGELQCGLPDMLLHRAIFRVASALPAMHMQCWQPTVQRSLRVSLVASCLT
jgi:hypothetical protein